MLTVGVAHSERLIFVIMLYASSLFNSAAVAPLRAYWAGRTFLNTGLPSGFKWIEALNSFIKPCLSANTALCIWRIFSTSTSVPDVDAVVSGKILGPLSLIHSNEFCLRKTGRFPSITTAGRV